MKKYLLLPLFLLLACSKGSQTTYTLDCNGSYTVITAAGASVDIVKQKRYYEIDQNQMSQRTCSKEGLVLNCYKEIELPNFERSKEQFIYNTGDYSLSDVSVTIGIDKSTGKPIFLNSSIFRAVCPMTVRRSKKDS